MHGSLDEPPIVIRQSRGALALRLAMWVILTGTLVLALEARHHGVNFAGVAIDEAVPSIVLYPALFLFTALAALAAFSLARPAELTAAPDGVTWRTMWLTQHLDWDDVEQFVVRVESDRSSRRLVMYNLSQRYMWAHAHLQYPFGSFGIAWDEPPQDVADLLNAAKLRWSGVVERYEELNMMRVA